MSECTCETVMIDGRQFLNVKHDCPQHSDSDAHEVPLEVKPLGQSLKNVLRKHRGIS